MGLFDFFKKKPSTEPTQADTAANKQFYSIVVAKVVHETADAVSIYLDIPANLQTVFSYKAGQYITLRINLNNQTYLRSYSLSSCPHSNNYYRIAVKRKAGGAVSGWLVDKLQRGATLEVFPPLGNFTPSLDTFTDTYFLYAGGSGITPMLAIAKTVLSQTKSDVVLLYANRNEDQIIYQLDLIELSKEYEKRLFIYHILDEPPAKWTGLKGIFKQADYAEFLRNTFSGIAVNRAEHYICGPTPMMHEVENALTKDLMLPPNVVHVEYFEIEKQPHENPNQTTNKNADNASQSKADKSANTTELNLTIAGKKQVVMIAPNQTILSACLDAGIDAPFMCEAGVCASCKAKVISGKVSMRACYSLSDKEIKDGYILTCQSEPQTDTLQITYDV